MKNLAPIILFAYNRPYHTQETLHYLSQNVLAEESILIVYCDGAKQDASEENKLKIKQVRELVKAQNWPKEIHVVESETNKGLANSIIGGVREVTEKYGKAIVLEDDIITSKYFLQYMNDALNCYENDERVLSIGACNFFAHDENTPETFFIPIPDCWGWATWKNRWQLFEEDGSKLLKQLHDKNLIHSFNVEGAYDFEQMLKDQIAGLNNSWAIRWQALAYVQNKMALYPKFAQSHNIGFDANATHTTEYAEIFNTKAYLHQEVKVTKMDVFLLPEVFLQMKKGYALSVGGNHQISFVERILLYLKRKLKIS
ncbi:MAG: glycosyltransferase family A protein [Flavobacteriales bacterium]